LREVYARHSTDNGVPFIAVKMDIEGAEYDVLEHMKEEGTLDMVDYLGLEFHAHRFPDHQRDNIRKREEMLRSVLEASSSTYVHEGI